MILSLLSFRLMLPDGCLQIPTVVDKALDRFAWTNGGRPPAEAAALHHRAC